MEALASVTKEGADQPSQGEKAESETEDASKQEPFWAKVYLARHYDRLGNTGIISPQIISLVHKRTLYSVMMCLNSVQAARQSHY